MAAVDKSEATLRIIGDQLEPERISALLGATPDKAERKGQEILGKSGTVRISKTGCWSIRASAKSPEYLDAQIAELLGRLTDDLEIWKSLTREYRVDIFCGLFMHEMNEGLSLSPDTMKALSDRGIELGLDIYAGPSDQA